MVNQQILKEKEKRLSAIISTLPDMLFHIDREGNFISVFRDDNPDAVFKSEDFAGKKISDVFKNDHSALFLEIIKKTLAEGKFEDQFTLNWNKPLQISVKCSKLNEDEIICIARDVTSQKEAKEALRVSEERYRNLIENISEVIYETDENLTIKYISPSIEKITGYTSEDFTGKSLFVLTGESSRQFANGFNDQDNLRTLSHENKLFNKQGEAVWIRFTIKPLIRNGEVRGCIGTLVDSTEEKKIELSLMKSEKQYRLLAENISDVIWVVNLTQKKPVYISPSMIHLRGYSAEEVMNQNLEDIFLPASVRKLMIQIKTNAKKIINNPSHGKYDLTEIQQKCKDGSLVWTETTNRYRITETEDIEVHGVTRNIENRKNAELQLFKYADDLKISEEKFFKVFNNSTVMMVISHPDRRGIVDVNRQFVNSTGYTREEMINQFSLDLGLFENSSHAIKIRELFKTGGQITDFETSIRTKSGTPLTCLLSIHHIKLQNNEMLLTSAVDISPLKKNERKIEHLLKQQRLISEISQLLNRPEDPEKVFTEVLSIVGQHTGVSRVYVFEDLPDENPPCRLFEWTSPGISSMKSMEMASGFNAMFLFKDILSENGCIFSQNINELPADVCRVLESHDVKSLLVYPLYAEDINCGAIGFDECSKNKLWSSDEIDLLRTVSIIVSSALERKKVLEKLSFSELKYKLAIDSAKEGLWDWDILAGRVSYSEMWCRLMGYDISDINHDYSVWETSIYPDDKSYVLEALNNHLSGKTGTYETRYRIKKKDGRIRWFLDHGMVVERNDRNEPTRAIGMIIDITSQVENEVRLKESINTQQKLFSIISHDLRGPLGNFMQVLDLLSKGRDLDERIKDRLLEELKKSSRTTFALLENLLNWSKSQTNVISLEPWYYSISKFLHDNVELAAPIANQKFINIIINADDRMSAFCDRNSINLVIRNLLSNAIKFTREYGTVRVTARDTGNNIEVEVEDNGVGMEKETVENIFKSNAFESSYGTNNEKGSGLGLLLCRDFVERNGGKLQAESTPGQGSRFIFSLPKN